jgi:hypothetical protein
MHNFKELKIWQKAMNYKHNNALQKNLNLINASLDHLLDQLDQIQKMSYAPQVKLSQE